MGTLLDAIIFGSFQAAPLVLAAIGFTMIFYLSRFINVAYGENITIGAYFAVIFNTTLGVNFYLTIIPSAVLAGLLSVATYLLVFRPVMRRNLGSAELIILSVGLSFAIRHALRLIFGIENYAFETGPIQSVQILGRGITIVQITSVLLAVLIAIGLYLFIFKTDYGQRMRALAGNEDLAQISGINPTRVSVLIWFFAGVAGGLAGIFNGVFSFHHSDRGWEMILIVIMVSTIGGVGNVRGALIAGVLAGVLTSYLTQYVPNTIYAQVVLLLLFIVVLKATRRTALARA